MNMHHKNNKLLFLLTLLVTACGGGGGGGGGSNTPPPTPAPGISFSATPTSVLLNNTSTFTWSSTNATSCTASGSGNWTGTKATSGTEDVSIDIAGNTAFTLSCSGAGGTRNASVTVEGYRQTDGVVVDGYISGANVFIDENANFIADDEENATTSDNDGKFTIKYANGNLVSIGGTDLDSQILLDNLLITHKLDGYTDFKAVTPITSVDAFIESVDVNAALGIDSSINIGVDDPVALKGDGGIYDYLYEKGNQLTVLAYALQNITNDLNTTTETTEDYFKAIAEEVEKEFNETSVKVDIETETFVNKAFENIITAKSVTINDTAKENTVKALSGVLPVVEVKASDDLTTSVIRFAVSTLQEDIKAVANGTASAEKVASYTTDVIKYIAQDQNINSDDITPDITAIDDNPSTDEDTPITINVLANDSFITTSPIIIDASNGENGTVEIAESSPPQITYSPNSDYFGDDLFSYTITQGNKVSSANVAVEINPVNDSPSIDIASTILVPENQLTVATVSVSDIDGDDLILSLGGVDEDSFSLSNENILTFKEAPNYEVKDSYSLDIFLTDNEDTITKSVQIIIDDVQEIFIVDDYYSSNEDTISIIDVTSNDIYIDTNILIKVESSENGNVSIDSSGNVKFIPNLNWYGDEEIIYTIEAGGESRSGKLFLTYLPINDPPQIEVIKRIDLTIKPKLDGTGNAYTITDDQNKDILFNDSIKYIFSYTSEHPLKFSTTEDGTHNGGSEYSDIIIESSDNTLIVQTNSSTPDTIYYYCDLHPGMGGSFSRSNSPITLNENLSGSIVEILANDVENDILTISLQGDDSNYFSLNENIISINTKPDFENPIDTNSNNIYKVSYEVSDGSLQASFPIDLIINDVNYPATLVKDFKGPGTNCRDFGYNSAIDEDGNTVILSGCTQGRRSDIYAYQLNNNVWNRMESKQFAANYEGPTSNNINSGTGIFLNDNGDRFAKTDIPAPEAGKSSIIIPYDYSKKYEGVLNWNETFEMGGERSSFFASTYCSDNSNGGADMSSSGKYFIVWSSSCANENGQSARSYIKVFSLNTSPEDNGGFSTGLMYEAEFNEQFLGQNSINDADISNDGKTLAIAFNPKPAGGDGDGFVRIYKWDGVFKGSEDNYIKEADINFCSDASINPNSLWDVELSSDGTHLLMSLFRYSDAICVVKNIDNNWVQKGQIIKGNDINSYLQSASTTSHNISSNGNRIAIEYYAKDSQESSRGMEIIIFDWSSLTEEWKKSGSNISAGIGKELSGQVSMNSNGSYLIMHTEDTNSNSNGSKEGSAMFYFLPEN